MDVIQGLQSRFFSPGETALTVGNFDGVHLGHRKLIQNVVSCAQEKKLQGGMMTFDPHPLKVLAPAKETKMIFPLEDRLEVAETMGLNFVVVEPFSRNLSELEPEVFFERLLVEKLHTKYLFVGHDFTFGRHRKGTPDVLRELCRIHDVALEILPPVTIDGEIVSSSKIRHFIAEGQVDKASTFLGRPFYLKGVVEKGAGRGRGIGFPTANLFTDAELFPKKGVYITLFEIGGRTYHSVTNVGSNPTFHEKTKRPVQVETHILDFNRDIYGEQVKASFLYYLRDEVKFASVDQLVAQIKKDVEQARSYVWPAE